jgi:sigma-B regulation protein RsbU (phosphoserine phosphatase)
MAPSGKVSPINLGRSFPVGVRDKIACAAGETTLAPGDCLFLYTDGVTEALNPDEQLFGDERLTATLQSVAGRAPQEVVRTMLRDVRAFAGSAAASDDIAVLACRWNG